MGRGEIAEWPAPAGTLRSVITFSRRPADKLCLFAPVGWAILPTMDAGALDHVSISRWPRVVVLALLVGCASQTTTKDRGVSEGGSGGSEEVTSGGSGGSPIGGRGGAGGMSGTGASPSDAGPRPEIDANSGGGQADARPEGDGNQTSPDGTRATDGPPSTIDPMSGPASGMHGFRWEVPCEGATFPAGDTCRWDATRFSRTFKKEITFGGEAGTTYEVTIRIRGVTEPRTYELDGKVVNPGPKPSFLVGGTPVPGNDYNVYRIVVSKPAQTYHLNAYRQVGHMTFDVDYQATIKVEGKALVSMEGQDSNQEEISNYHRYVIPGIPPAPNPFNGQFLQLDVVSVRTVAP